MSRVLFAAASAAAFTLAANQAAAQDWQGLYFGVAGGYGVVDDDESETVRFDANLDGNFGDTIRNTAGVNAFGPATPVPGGFCGGSPKSNNLTEGCDADDEGLGEISLRAGYDWQSGPWVYGVVGEFTNSDASDSVTAFSITPAQYSFKRELDTLVAVRARLGYAYGRFLPYVTAGGAYGTIANSFVTSNTVNSFDPIRNEDEHGGFQFGGGLETEVTDNLRLGVEYLYTSIEDGSGLTTRVGRLASPPTAATSPFLLVNPNGTDFLRSESDFNLHSFRLTATVSF